MGLGFKSAKKLYQETLNDITGNPDEWVSFLNSSTWMFGYTFGEQVLIYAQNPNARACATMEQWNTKMYRWIRKGSKAITILKYENGVQNLENIFDISDTYQKYGKEQWLWSLDKNYSDEYIEALESKYGELEDKSSLDYAIISAVNNLVEDNLKSYIDELNSLDFEIDENVFSELVRSSVTYSALTRCGIDPNIYINKDKFKNISLFNNQAVVTIYGTACRELTRDFIIETRTFVKNQKRSFDIKQKQLYVNNDEKNREGRNLYGRVQEDKRLSNTELGNRESKSDESEWQIRKSEGELPNEVQDRNIRVHEDERNINPTSQFDTSGLRRTSRVINGTNERRREDNGRNETIESNAVGTENELHQDVSRGNNNERTGIQLNFLLSEEEQNEKIAEAFDSASAFLFTQEMIDSVLREGSHIVEGKFRIYKQLSSNASSKDNADFLKLEYGDGGRSGDDNGVIESHSAKGIELRISYDDDSPKMLLSWSKVEKRIKELINLGWYFNDKEKIEYNNWLKNREDIKDEEILLPVNEDLVEKIDYHITDDNLGEGSLKDKFRNNINAIKTLKLCENENRLATKEEQEILAKYVGWGGLSKAFDINATEWKDEYEELKQLLTDEEYEKARSSTLTAFYTPPIVISSMYKALANMNFKRGNILEPSCGTGNFIGRLPEEMNSSKIYGVEIDSLTGRIAKQLYQNSTIAIQGFEEADLPDNSFDVVIGNVPFGDFKITDKRYDKYNFLIHDYFFAKSLDKVRKGGIVAFITSKGTLDKANSNFREYISQRAELIGAIRLPNNTFSKNAETKVTSDIIFLKKRENPISTDDRWIHVATNDEGININQYFIDNPQMVLGRMEMVTNQFGKPDSICKPFEDANLKELLEMAINNLNGRIEEIELDEVSTYDEDTSILADLNVRNFSYTLRDNKIYYRENSRMFPQELSSTAFNRIKGLIDIRDSTRRLIELQTKNASEQDIKYEQNRLNIIYDSFVKEYGRISERANRKVFEEDSSYYLLSSLEIFDDKGNFLRKADMFSKRTINVQTKIENVSTSSEALIASISEKAKVDLDYMSNLLGISKESIIEELKGVIFKEPYSDVYVTADEYLSGNIREKLKVAKDAINADDSLDINIKYLENAMPKPLTAGEITAKLGSTWIPPEVYQDFMYELLNPPFYYRNDIKVHYSDITSNWNISGKSLNNGNIKVYNTYGTSRVNAYKILEASLNLKNIKVFDNVIDEDGTKRRVLNKKETAIASSKQDLIKEEFDNWVYKDQERRNYLVNLYNEKFNSIKPREFNGEHIIFKEMNPEISLRTHQVNAIAHILYGGNTLLAHEVGAGKTFEMVAAAMESKRLGLCNKSLFVVPNHIIEQFASEFLQLYPSANILVATEKDFSTNYRKRFCSKIATGEYDAIIIGHSQFEKIPLSPERQKEQLNNQLSDIILGIEDAKNSDAERYTIKELEKSKKRIEEKLKKLNDQSRKDNVVYFEELGVDKMFVDEAHNYKNLYLYSKMRNVSGIAQTEAQKSSDLFMKCRYLDEVTNNRGVVFATGTPVSNSMVELYTMQRYLQYDSLLNSNLQHFDSWASTFGETITSIELAPEGTSYRTRTSFAKFNNLPELMSMFKEIADIQTADTLHLPVPEAEFHNVLSLPSDFQKEIVRGLGERAELIRSGSVDPSQDNMLKITNDGRKLALDQRLLNSDLPNYDGGKINICAKNIYDIYKEYDSGKMAQLVFCDLSTPKDLSKSSELFDIVSKDNNAEVPFIDAYTELKCNLIKKGIPKEEIAFIHEADNEIKKKELFSKVRNGTVRVLIGSTSKMGAGTNCQTKLIALHDLDCPWRPADVEHAKRKVIMRTFESIGISSLAG